MLASLRFEYFRESPGTLEERLWKRLKWDWPADETEVLWWVANFGEEDKTKEVKLICRSLACMRMELHKARLATSAKLRAEWDKRLDKNALAVDCLNSNRDLWMRAGGPDPELLVTPSESLLEESARTVAILHQMLEKHGPCGGRYLII